MQQERLGLLNEAGMDQGETYCPICLPEPVSR